jgi:hypothetical protein
LVWFASLAEELAFKDVTRAPGIAAVSLLPDVEVNTNSLLSTGRLAIQQERRVAPLISMGLLNCLGLAKRENDLQRRDELLVELRQLHQAL